MLRATFIGVLFALKACDPAAIGVQNFGSVVGRVYDAKTLKAIPGKVLVSATGCNNPVYADPDGTFLLNQVAEGTQTVTATAPELVGGTPNWAGSPELSTTSTFQSLRTTTEPSVVWKAAWPRDSRSLDLPISAASESKYA